jgi:light-regulated signal transduction histidine kinase (bacteriophytochrome)
MGNTDKSGVEDEIERLRQQLDRANTDFEEFVSMAAHNLRQSLRDIALYSQLMSETYLSRLDSDAGVFLGRIQAGAADMQSLLADVVDYWATGDGDRLSSRTDMEVALCQALLCTDKQINERNAVVTHDPLPVVTGDFGVLTKLLRHLIRNAIEYCVAPSPQVHISSKRVELDWVFAVADNGPGLEPTFQGRIFEPFKRLHGKEYPGNGLGLAFCKKAIEEHGGRMWVESTPGAGSAFYFTLRGEA